ncbi:HAD family hydrolase [Populibacterium corticicola]|uniref:HAD family hydrolase n=1 Tax=Populibacterium corticicola TaxID=1812826 RepID=A0ABW5XL60_9MICO
MTSDKAIPPAKVAAFFDLDKTIIATSSASAFSRPFYAGGLLSGRAIVSSAYAHFLFMVGGANADQTERMRVQLSNLITGWPVEQVSAVVSETLHQYIDPYVYAEALELIERHRDQGHDIVIVSASGAEVVFPIANMLEATHAVATRMEIVEGKYTGTIEFYAYGENKAKAIRDLAQEHGYDLDRSFAYSDSITDIPMLEAVGNAYTVNADRIFRQEAQERGWTSLVFQRPVALRKASMQRTTALGITLIAGAVTLAWLLARHRRRRRST